MVVRDGERVRKESIHKAVDELPVESLTELASFIDYLQYKSKPHTEGTSPLREMYDAFAPVREAVDAMGLSEAEIDAIIDETIDEVRGEGQD